MNDRSDTERLLRTWFADGPETMPDRVVLVVADRIARNRQRRAWRLLRRPFMNAQMRFVVGLAAVLVIAFTGWSLLPRQGGTGEPNPTPSPTASASPSSSPIATGPLALPEGTVAGGQYRLTPDFLGASILAEVPAGWQGSESSILTSPGDTSNTGVLIGFVLANGLFSNPCHWDVQGTKAEDQPGDVVVGPTVDDLVAALRANRSYTSTAPTPLSFGKFTGQHLELQLPGKDVLSTCDRRTGDGTGTYYVFSGNGFYAQGPNSRWDLFIVDVNGTRLITLMSIAEGSSTADLAAARAIVDSFVITP
jgi:hypothetical protein